MAEICGIVWKGEESIGTDFIADVYSCAADPAGLYRMAFEKAEKGSGCERQGDDAAAPGATD